MKPTIASDGEARQEAQADPPTNSITNSTAASRSAVPRSGCATTSSIGTPASATSVAIEGTLSTRSWRARYTAMTAITARTANSDGWNWKPANEIQRWAPFCGMADRLHRDEGEHDGAVEDVPPLLEPPVVDERADDHRARADHVVGDLTLQVVRGLERVGRARRRVHHHGPDRAEHEDCHHEREIDLAQDGDRGVVLLAARDARTPREEMGRHDPTGYRPSGVRICRAARTPPARRAQPITRCG